MTEIENIELEAKMKSRRLMNEICFWLNEADIDYKKELWGSAEGISIILDEVTFEFYDSGRIEIVPNEQETLKDE